MNYNLTKPCGNCPFRSDKLFPLHPRRALDIATNDSEFACHKTVDYSGDDGGEIKDKSEHCAGLLIMLEQMNQPHQMMRVLERIGLYDRTKLDMSSPVYEDIDDYVSLLEERESE